MKSAFVLASVLFAQLAYAEVQPSTIGFTCALPAMQSTIIDCGDGPFIAKPGAIVKIRVHSNNGWIGSATFTLVDFDSKRGLGSVTPPEGGDATFVWTNDSGAAKRVSLTLSQTHAFRLDVSGAIQGVAR